MVCIAEGNTDEAFPIPTAMICAPNPAYSPAALQKSDMKNDHIGAELTHRMTGVG